MQILNIMRHYCFFVILLLLVLSQVTFSQIEKKPINIGESFTINSEILNQDREIYVWLPQGYDTTKYSYPVHFLLDGEITFLAYCGITHIMSLAGQIPEAIIVGIPNINRGFDLSPKKNASKFLEFIVDELATYIESEYRVNDQKVITGYSMAGNFVIYTFLKEHIYFDSYISGSPYRLDLYTDNDLSIKHLESNKKITLYASMGDEDRSDQLEAYISFRDLLDQKALDNFDFIFSIEEAKNHDTNIIPNWRNGLEYIYRHWKSGE